MRSPMPANVSLNLYVGAKFYMALCDLTQGVARVLQANETTAQ